MCYRDYYPQKSKDFNCMCLNVAVNYCLRYNFLTGNISVGHLQTMYKRQNRTYVTTHEKINLEDNTLNCAWFNYITGPNSLFGNKNCSHSSFEISKQLNSCVPVILFFIYKFKFKNNLNFEPKPIGFQIKPVRTRAFTDFESLIG